MSAPSLSLADRFALILQGLSRAVAARCVSRPADRPGLVLLWAYLQRRIAQFARLVERLRLGTLPQPRPATPPRAPRPGVPLRTRWPGRFAWLVPLVPEAAAYGSQLHALLAEPEMASLIAAAPQTGRILRPLCRMLGQNPAPARLPPPSRGTRTRTLRAAGPPPDVPAASPPAKMRPARWWTLGLRGFRRRVPA